MKKSRSPVQGSTRRDVLIGSAGLAAAAATCGGVVRAQTSAHTIPIGDARVSVFSDGTMTAPLDWVLPKRPRAEVEAAFKEEGQAFVEIGLQVNVAVVRSGKQVILIDAGGGSDFAPARGKLPDNLERGGIKPEDVTAVVFTHAHPDHFWGVIDPLDSSSALFPNAKLYMAAAERDTWLKPGVETGVPDAVRGSALGTQRRIKELGDKIETFKVGQEVLPGLTAIDTGGHTPGHVSMMLTSGSGRLLIGGDALTHSIVSFARPDWLWGADWDGERAIATRKRLLDMLTTDKAPLLGYHLPWPGVGRVEKRGTGYRFVQT